LLNVVQNKQLYQVREFKSRQPSTDESRLTKTGSQESRDGGQKEHQQSIKVVLPFCFNVYFTVLSIITE